jgi:hypothetical protein
MKISRTITVIALSALACSAAACDKKSGEGGGAASSASAPATGGGGAAAAGSKRKLKTKLTGKQITETYESTIKNNHDFKKHQELVTAKLGAPMKVEGDQAWWWGYQPAEGSQQEDCIQISVSPTKGSGTQGTSGEDKCWEK